MRRARRHKVFPQAAGNLPQACRNSRNILRPIPRHSTFRPFYFLFYALSNSLGPGSPQPRPRLPAIHQIAFCLAPTPRFSVKDVAQLPLSAPRSESACQEIATTTTGFPGDHLIFVQHLPGPRAVVHKRSVPTGGIHRKPSANRKPVQNRPCVQVSIRNFRSTHAWPCRLKQSAPGHAVGFQSFPLLAPARNGLPHPPTRAQHGANRT